MIISKYGKSYDTADGSEQQFGRERRQAPSAAQSSTARWEDDGGGPSVVHSTPSFATKPGWSVLSLRDLMAAIRRTNDPDDPVRLRHEAQRAGYERLRRVELRKARAAEAAHAEANRDRNPWENT